LVYTGRLEVGAGGVAPAHFSGAGRADAAAVRTPLAVEYESVLNRPGMLPPALGADEITGFPDGFVSVSTRHRVHYCGDPAFPTRRTILCWRPRWRRAPAT
jgi:hypothetical protein